MDYKKDSTKERKKGEHLFYEHRIVIQTRLKDGWSAKRKICAWRFDLVLNLLRNAQIP